MDLPPSKEKIGPVLPPLPKGSANICAGCDAALVLWQQRAIGHRLAKKGRQPLRAGRRFPRGAAEPPSSQFAKSPGLLRFLSIPRRRSAAKTTAAIRSPRTSASKIRQSIFFGRGQGRAKRNGFKVCIVLASRAFFGGPRGLHAMIALTAFSRTFRLVCLSREFKPLRSAKVNGVAITSIAARIARICRGGRPELTAAPPTAGRSPDREPRQSLRSSGRNPLALKAE